MSEIWYNCSIINDPRVARYNRGVRQKGVILMPTSKHTTFCIYRIVNFRNGKIYIGQTNDPRARKTRHFNDLKRQLHYNSHLQQSYNKWGADSFFFEVLESDIEKEHINEREIYWVAYFDSYRKGYNQNIGGLTGYHNGKLCVWNGIEYPSIAEAAIANNMRPSTLYARLSRGVTSESDMIGSKGNSPKTPCVWNGIHYPTIRQAAKALGIQQSSMRERLLKGYTRDEDLKRKGGNNVRQR